jgi:polyribonucleotide 5'-hydroxyl-kinase
VSEYQAPDSALPIGASRTTKETQLVEVDPMQPRAAIELVNFVCAISQAEDDAPDEEVVSSPVLGFIHM